MSRMEVDNFIGGELKKSFSAQTFKVEFPFFPEDGLILPNSDSVDLSVTVSKAKKAMPRAAAIPLKQRIGILRSAAEKLTLKKEEIDYLVRTTGIPFSEVKKKAEEIKEMWTELPRHFTARYHAEEGDDAFFQRYVQGGMVYRRPLDGIISAFIASNDPRESAFVLGHMVLTGNVGILKPSSREPYFPVKLAQALTESGYPAGAINVILWDSQDRSRMPAAYQLIEESALRILFGDDATLNMLRYETSADGKTVDHGAKGKFILFGTGRSKSLIDSKVSDLPRAVREISASALDYSISCVSTKAVFIDESVYEPAKAEFIKAFRARRGGDPLQAGTDIGCYEGLDKTLEQVRQSAKFGMMTPLLPESLELARPGQPKAPMLLEVHEPASEFLSNEYPIPILALYEYRGLEQGIEALNKASHLSAEHKSSLAVSIYSDRLPEIMGRLLSLEAYHLNLNTPTTSMHHGLPHHGYFLSEHMSREISVNDPAAEAGTGR